MPRAGFRMDMRRRLAKRAIYDPGASLLWAGQLTACGYGRMRVEGRKVVAHRVAYETYVGRIPDGLELDHLCRVRRCINPLHLEPVTHHVNVQRAVAAARSEKRCSA